MGDDKGFACCCICILILGAAGGGGAGIYYATKKTITPTSPVLLIPLTDGNYAMGNYLLTETDAKGIAHNVKLILSQVVFNSVPSNLRIISGSNPTSQYKIHATLPDSGFRFTFDQNLDVRVGLDVETLTDYIITNKPLAKQMMEKLSATPDPNQINETQSILKLQQELNKIFDKELNATGEFEFSKTPTVQLVFNYSSSQYQPIKGSATTNRRMLVRRILFLQLVFDFLGQIIKDIAIPAIDLIRKNGPQIGKIAGGLVGGALGGVEGFSQGVKIGEKIGLAAQSFFEACIPENTLTIRCTADGVKSVVTDLAKDIAQDVVSDTIKNALCGKKKCRDITSMSSKPATIKKK